MFYFCIGLPCVILNTMFVWWLVGNVTTVVTPPRVFPYYLCSLEILTMLRWWIAVCRNLREYVKIHCKFWSMWCFYDHILRSGTAHCRCSLESTIRRKHGELSTRLETLGEEGLEWRFKEAQPAQKPHALVQAMERKLHTGCGFLIVEIARSSPEETPTALAQRAGVPSGEQLLFGGGQTIWWCCENFHRTWCRGMHCFLIRSWWLGCTARKHVATRIEVSSQPWVLGTIPGATWVLSIWGLAY